MQVLSSAALTLYKAVSRESFTGDAKEEKKIKIEYCS